MASHDSVQDNEIKQCQRLWEDVSNTNQSKECIKNAWNVICKFGNVCKPYELCALILMVLGLVFDSKRLLEIQASCLNPKEASNCTANRFSVPHFFFENLRLVYAV